VTEATTCLAPVSWLRLERDALGELAAAERAEVAAHLSTCASCRACADLIATDAQRALPALPVAVETAPAAKPAAKPAAVPWRERLRRAWPGWWYALGAGTAVTVLALAFLLPRGRDDGGGIRGARVVAVKGGDVAVELVRERDGSIAWEPVSFVPGDRFKVMVTCAPPLQVHADIVVLQSDGPAYPGQPTVVGCGNRIAVPPAFRITGPGAATVCVGLDATGPPSRAALAAGDAAPVPHACVRLDRAK
jgi:hypothetical protein